MQLNVGCVLTSSLSTKVCVIKFPPVSRCLISYKSRWLILCFSTNSWVHGLPDINTRSFSHLRNSSLDASGGTTDPSGEYRYFVVDGILPFHADDHSCSSQSAGTSSSYLLFRKKTQKSSSPSRRIHGPGVSGLLSPFTESFARTIKVKEKTAEPRGASLTSYRIR